MYTAQLPMLVDAPQMIASNADLVAILVLIRPKSPDLRYAQVFAVITALMGGPSGASPCGSSIRQLNPQLGDGAVLWVKLSAPTASGHIQLKGSGPLCLRSGGWTDGNGLAPVMRNIC
jgi:uncharacterized protein YdiU (UPF0061 family)